MEVKPINEELFVSSLRKGVVEFAFLKENLDLRTVKGTRNVAKILELGGTKPANYYEEVFSDNEGAKLILFFDVELGAIKGVLANKIVPRYWTNA